MRKIFALAIIGLGFLVGCAHNRNVMEYHIAVDSLSSPEAEQKRTYVIFPGNKNTTLDDLQFREFSAYLNRILLSKGFTLAPSATEADLAIVLSYGIGDPQITQLSVPMPVWGQTGIASTQTTGRVNVIGNTATYSGATTNTPSYGVTGYNMMSVSRTEYFRFAQITGYDFTEYRKSSKELQLWRTTITSVGSNSDLRAVFPALIAAGGRYVASDTGKQLRINLKENDKSIRAMRGER